MATYFDKHCAALLNALGYTCAAFPASWEDVGGPESGPHIVGNPAFQEWTRPEPDGASEHAIIVCCGEVVETCLAPLGPEGWADQF